jgi:erythromycin esterase-like protein
VLEPTVAGGPWSLATWRAASTLQLHELRPDASDPASAATIAWALEVEAVERIVVGGEGRGAPPAAFSERVQAVRRLVHSITTRSVPVDAVWVDAAAGRRVTVQPDGAHDALLDALLHPRAERLDA